MYTLGAIC